jgi:hypothetical protein
MADKVDGSVVDALTIGNVKTIAEAGSFAMASLFQHNTNVARRVDSLSEAHLGKVLESFASADPVEAIAVTKLFKGEADSSIASLLAQLDTAQLATKLAQSTPGDISIELNKIGASVASLQGLMAGVVSILQQTIKGAQTTPPITLG